MLTEFDKPDNENHSKRYLRISWRRNREGYDSCVSKFLYAYDLKELFFILDFLNWKIFKNSFKLFFDNPLASSKAPLWNTNRIHDLKEIEGICDF